MAQFPRAFQRRSFRSGRGQTIGRGLALGWCLAILVCGTIWPAWPALSAPGEGLPVAAPASLGLPSWEVLESRADRTVVRLAVPCDRLPADWQAVDWQTVQWGLPLHPDEESADSGRFLPPRVTMSLAVPTRQEPSVQVRAVTWWREPQGSWAQTDLVHVSSPRIYRSVPMTGLEVLLSVRDGILRDLTLEILHAPGGEPASYLQMGARPADAAEFSPAGERVPAGILNPEVFEALSRGARAAALVARPSAAKAAEDPAALFAATDHWVKLRLQATGLHRLTGLQLSVIGVPSGDVDPAKLRLWRGGGLALADDPQVPPQDQPDRVGLQELAIEVRGAEDGEWNLDDEIRFYGVATSAWRDRFEAGAALLDHYDHPYAQDAIYWLTWEDDATASPLPGAPLRVLQPDTGPIGGQPLTQGRVRLHQEKQLLDEGGLVADNWVWDNFVYSSRDDDFPMWEPVPDSAAVFVVDVRGNYGERSFYPFVCRAWLNDDTAHAAQATFTVSAQTDSQRVRVVGESAAVHAGTNSLTLANDSSTYGTGSSVVSKQALALDSFDILYLAKLGLTPGLGAMEFILPAAEAWVPQGPVDLALQVPGGEPVTVWDVTAPLAPFIPAGGYTESGGEVFAVAYAPQGGGDRHLVAARDADILVVASGEIAHPIDVMAAGVDYDHLTIHAGSFSQAARDLAAFRAGSIPGTASPAAAAVLVDDIYDNFSGGQKDPRAIRNYLKAVYEQGAHRLRFVCLLGKACRDYRNFRERTPDQGFYDFLPTDYRTDFPGFPDPLTLDAPYASDDGLVSFDTVPPGELDLPDLAVGRLSVADAGDAADLVGRIIAYTADPEPGAWRNKATVAVDDANRPEHGSKPILGEIYHTDQADILVEDIVPLALDVQRIYGVAYDFPSPSSNVKPEMRADILTALSAGTTIFHYIGHGAEDNLADEQIFQSRDIPTLLNDMRRPVFMAFSCDVGVFDSPTRWSMAEQFVLGANGGAIAAICASQVSIGQRNDDLSYALYRQLYPGRRIVPGSTLGEALAGAKALMPYSLDILNSQRYTLFGDPAVTLPNPPDDLLFAADSVDTLVAGLKQTVKAAADGSVSLAPGDGYDLRVVDSSYDQAYTVYNYYYDSIAQQYVYTPTERTYGHSGATVFLGTGTQQGSSLAVPFKNPIQFRYGDFGRVRLTVDTGQGDHTAVAVVPTVRTTAGTGDDVLGPQIRMAFTDDRFRVRQGALLAAELADSSGVAILGTSPGNSLLLEFDDTGFMTNVTASFQYDPNSYTQGRLSFPLPLDLDLGKHRAALHASDALGNVGSDTLSFLLIPEGVKGMEDVTLFPNPTPGPCRLVFELSDPMDVQWDIYTLAGRRVTTIREEFTAPGPAILRWDGRDQRGDEIANGTYLYVLRGLAAAEQNGDLVKTGKLVIMR